MLIALETVLKELDNQIKACEGHIHYNHDQMGHGLRVQVIDLTNMKARLRSQAALAKHLKPESSGYNGPSDPRWWKGIPRDAQWWYGVDGRFLKLASPSHVMAWSFVKECWVPSSLPPSICRAEHCTARPAEA